MQYSPDSDDIMYYNPRYLAFFNTTESSDNDHLYGKKEAGNPQIKYKSYTFNGQIDNLAANFAMNQNLT